MSVSYILPLKAPPPLPATGVDIVSFKVWKNTLVAHIQQDANHFHFLPGGLYATWTAAEYGARILVLDNDDPEKVTLDGKRDQVGAAAHRVAVAQLSRLLEGDSGICFSRLLGYQGYRRGMQR